MRRSILALLALLFIASIANAQSSSVSLSVTDQGSVAWANGTYTFTYSGPANPTWSGGNLVSPVKGSLNASGQATVSVADTNTITPGPAFWIVRVCPFINGSAPCYTSGPTTITGVAPTLTLTPPAISISGQSNLPVSAYADAEIVAPVPLGFIYYNFLTTTTGKYRQCNAVTAGACTTWSDLSSGGGGSTCGSTNGQLLYNASGTCAGTPSITTDGAGNLTVGGSVVTGEVNATALVGGNLALTCDASGGNCTVQLGGNGQNQTTQVTGSQLSVTASSGMTVGSPTGGVLGLGTINATGLFVNGVAVSLGGTCPGAASTNTLLKTDGTNCVASLASDNGSLLRYGGTAGLSTPVVNKIFVVDGVTYPYSEAGVQSCINDAITAQIAGSGASVCDARAVGPITLSNELAVGNTTPNSITLLLPTNAVWSVSITDGTHCGIRQYNKTSIISDSSGGNGISMFIVAASSATNVEGLYCTDDSPSAGGVDVYARGFSVHNTVGATMARGAFVAQHLTDGAYYDNIQVVNTNGVGLKIYDVCCGAEFHHLVASGGNGAGARPMVLGDTVLGGAVNGGVDGVGFYTMSVTDPGVGQYTIEMGDATNHSNFNNAFENDVFTDVYMEGGTGSGDTTTPGIEVHTGVNNIGVYGFQWSNTFTGSTAYAVNIATNTSPCQCTFAQGKSSTGNLISDAITGENIQPGSLVQGPTYVSGQTYTTTVVPAGSQASPGIVFNSFNVPGFYAVSQAIVTSANGFSPQAENYNFSGEMQVASGGGFTWSGATSIGSGTDTGLTRGAAGVVDVGNGAAGNISGTVSAAHFTGGGNAGVTAGSFSAITAIAATGGIITTLTGTSDMRLKTDIHPYMHGLTEILALHPATYRWNEEGQKITNFAPDVEQAGFLAQDVKKVFPEAVGTEMHDGTEYLNFNDRPILAALVNSIKEQQKEIQKLRREISALSERK